MMGAQEFREMFDCIKDVEIVAEKKHFDDEKFEKGDKGKKALEKERRAARMGKRDKDEEVEEGKQLNIAKKPEDQIQDLVEGSEEDTQIRIGEKIIEVLSLHKKQNGRVDTAWGDKTPLGLYLTVKRIIDGDLPKESSEEVKEGKQK
jgi:hypothetical protein